MKNKVSKSLIVILGMIVFSFTFFNVASAKYYSYEDSYYGSDYDNSYYYGNGEGDSQYNYFYQQQPSFTTSNPESKSIYTTTTQPKNTVNNYYYYYYQKSATSDSSKTAVNNPIPVEKTTANNNFNTGSYDDVSKIDTNNNSYNYNNNLTSAAYDGYSRATNTDRSSKITALSFRGSGSFMPSSIWQWLIVVILILIIVIIARVLTHKTTIIKETHVSNNTPTPVH